MCDLALYQGTTLVVPKVPRYEWALAPAYSRQYAFICDAKYIAADLRVMQALPPKK
jgi:hypothetical protein